MLRNMSTAVQLVGDGLGIWIKTASGSRDGVLFIYLATPRSLRDLSSPTRDQTHAPAVEE